MSTQNGIPILGFAAYSGTGKTTLLEQIIQRLCQAGYQVGVLKQSHHDVEVDTAGKDSYRLRKAGAAQTLLCSPYRQVLIKESAIAVEPDLNLVLQTFDDQEIDIILVEGFKQTAFNKIELNRQALQKPLLYPNDDKIIALATDAVNQTHSIPVLDINNIETIIDFLLMNFLQSE